MTKKIEKIFETRVLHDGWELDNSLWVIEGGGGKRELRTTNHGGECEMSARELDEKIEETKLSYDGLLEAKRLAGEAG